MNHAPESSKSTVPPPVSAAEGPYAVLRDRNFVLYLAGRFAASLGQQMLIVAVGWELYERTHSALALGLVGLSNMAPMSVASLAVGFNFVFATRLILGTITLDLFAVLLGGATALLPIYAKDILHVGPSGLGFLQAALPVGSLLSALIVAHRPPLEKAGRTLLWAVAGFGLATIGFGFSRWFWVSWAMLFLCGMADNVSVVVRHTLVQLLTPDEKRGRVSAVNSLFIGTSNELGGFESGVVAHWLGPVFSVVSGGVGTLLVVLAVAWIWPEIRRYGRLGG